MEKFRVRVEQIDGEPVDLGRIGSEEGVEVEGFVFLGRVGQDETKVDIVTVTPVDLAVMFSGEDMLIAAAKAGEALTGIAKANIAKAKGAASSDA